MSHNSRLVEPLRAGITIDQYVKEIDQRLPAAALFEDEDYIARLAMPDFKEARYAADYVVRVDDKTPLPRQASLLRMSPHLVEITLVPLSVDSAPVPDGQIAGLKDLTYAVDAIGMLRPSRRRFPLSILNGDKGYLMRAFAEFDDAYDNFLASLGSGSWQTRRKVVV